MRLTKLLIIPAIIALSSCNDGWGGEAEDLFLQACREETANLNADDDQKEAFCECRLLRAKEKYPKLSDALANPDSLMSDAGMNKCMEELTK